MTRLSNIDLDNPNTIIDDIYAQSNQNVQNNIYKYEEVIRGKLKNFLDFTKIHNILFNLKNTNNNLNLDKIHEYNPLELQISTLK